MSKKKQFHQKQMLRFEVMDRAHMVLTHMEAALDGHPGLSEETKTQLEVCIEEGAILYQKAADEFFRRTKK